MNFIYIKSEKKIRLFFGQKISPITFIENRVDRFMERCIVCKKIIEEETICDSCSTFLKWKYGKNYAKKLEEFSKLNSGGKK